MDDEGTPVAGTGTASVPDTASAASAAAASTASNGEVEAVPLPIPADVVKEEGMVPKGSGIGDGNRGVDPIDADAGNKDTLTSFATVPTPSVSSSTTEGTPGAEAMAATVATARTTAVRFAMAPRDPATMAAALRLSRGPAPAARPSASSAATSQARRESERRAGDDDPPRDDGENGYDEDDEDDGDEDDDDDDDLNESGEAGDTTGAPSSEGEGEELSWLQYRDAMTVMAAAAVVAASQPQPTASVPAASHDSDRPERTRSGTGDETTDTTAATTTTTTVIQCPVSQCLHVFRRTNGALVWRSALYSSLPAPSGPPSPSSDADATTTIAFEPTVVEQWYAVVNGRFVPVACPNDLCADEDVQFVAPTRCAISAQGEAANTAHSAAPSASAYATRYTVLRGAGSECSVVYIEDATGLFYWPGPSAAEPRPLSYAAGTSTTTAQQPSPSSTTTTWTTDVLHAPAHNVGGNRTTASHVGDDGWQAWQFVRTGMPVGGMHREIWMRRVTEEDRGTPAAPARAVRYFDMTTEQEVTGEALAARLCAAGGRTETETSLVS